MVPYLGHPLPKHPHIVTNFTYCRLWIKSGFATVKVIVHFGETWHQNPEQSPTGSSSGLFPKLSLQCCFTFRHNIAKPFTACWAYLNVTPSHKCHAVLILIHKKCRLDICLSIRAVWAATNDVFRTSKPSFRQVQQAEMYFRNRFLVRVCYSG